MSLHRCTVQILLLLPILLCVGCMAHSSDPNTRRGSGVVGDKHSGRKEPAREHRHDDVNHHGGVNSVPRTVHRDHATGEKEGDPRNSEVPPRGAGKRGVDGDVQPHHHYHEQEDPKEERSAAGKGLNNNRPQHHPRTREVHDPEDIRRLRRTFTQSKLNAARRHAPKDGSSSSGGGGRGKEGKEDTRMKVEHRRQRQSPPQQQQQQPIAPDTIAHTKRSIHHVEDMKKQPPPVLPRRQEALLQQHVRNEILRARLKKRHHRSGVDPQPAEYAVATDHNQSEERPSSMDHMVEGTPLEEQQTMVDVTENGNQVIPPVDPVPISE